MLYQLATHLGCTVGHLMRTLSAQEFARWCLVLGLEPLGPRAAIARHAELLAAVHNSGRVAPAGDEKGLFRAEQFMPADPWAAPKPPRAVTNEDLKRMHEAHNAAELAAMAG